MLYVKLAANEFLGQFFEQRLVGRRVGHSKIVQRFDKTAAENWIGYVKIQVSLATKLRLVNTASRSSGSHAEKGVSDPLIGGGA